MISLNNFSMINLNEFSLRSISNRDLPKDVVLSINTVKFDQLLSQKDFEAIIKDPDLFFLAYCRALFFNQNKKEARAFLVSIEGQNVTVSGSEPIILEVQKKVEEIRQFFVEGNERQENVAFLVARKATYVFLRKESPVIDLCGDDLSYFWYDPFIESALPKLAELCGASYIQDKKKQLAVLYRDDTPSSLEVQVVKINWKEDVHLVYPISPKVIPEQEEMRKALYALYQKQQLCDFSLICKDGAVKIHSSLLFLFGGPVFQNLLTSEMKETQDKIILLAEYSQSTIRAFMDFVYLGGRAFSEKVISSNSQETTNLFELFEFANLYQVKALIDCCTNLISLVATKQDLEAMQYLANLYDNEHLKLLCEHLSPKENTVIIKV